MLTITRTTAADVDFCELVKELDTELAVIDGTEHSFYAQFNKVDMIKYAVVAYENNKPVGCGAIKQFSPEAMEVKRMYVPRSNRNKGITSSILKELEAWAKELGYKKCILETGKRQPDAIRLYTKNGYIQTPNYGHYIGKDNSVCFERVLT